MPCSSNYLSWNAFCLTAQFLVHYLDQGPTFRPLFYFEFISVFIATSFSWFLSYPMLPTIFHSPLLPFPSHLTTPSLSLSAENFSASRSHRTTPDQRTHAQSQGTPNTPNMSVLREEDYTHCSDTSVTALISIDLKSLGGVWSSCPSSSAHEKNSSMGAFESNLHVTFSGGEESLVSYY